MLVRMMNPHDDLPRSVANHHPSPEPSIQKRTVTLGELSRLISVDDVVILQVTIGGDGRWNHY